MKEIKLIKAEEILDSRGNPTLKVTVSSENNSASFAVPSGASTGIHEAHELRDGGERFFGKGVLKAKENIEKIIFPALKGMDFEKQKEIDEKLRELDGTENKSNLGGNAIIGVSIACLKLTAKESGKEIFEYLIEKYDTSSFAKMPIFYMNMINGGAHAESEIAFQEYMIVPETETVIESLEIAHRFQKELKKEIKKELKMKAIGIGDEGGFVLDTNEVKKPLEIFSKITKELNLENKIKFALDVAASSFYKEGKYFVNAKDIKKDELLEIYENMNEKYNILSIEDPFWEENFGDFAELQSKNCLVVGDDLTVTNKKRLQEAIDKNSIGALIIKPNQIGTLTETIETIKLAKENNIKCIMSHRSGESTDTFISDLAFAFGCFGIKAGALQRGERIAKYNRFLEIEGLLK